MSRGAISSSRCAGGGGGGGGNGSDGAVGFGGFAGLVASFLGARVLAFAGVFFALTAFAFATDAR